MCQTAPRSWNDCLASLSLILEFYMITYASFLHTAPCSIQQASPGLGELIFRSWINVIPVGASELTNAVEIDCLVVAFCRIVSSNSDSGQWRTRNFQWNMEKLNYGKEQQRMARNFLSCAATPLSKIEIATVLPKKYM